MEWDWTSLALFAYENLFEYGRGTVLLSKDDVLLMRLRCPPAPIGRKLGLGGFSESESCGCCKTR